MHPSVAAVSLANPEWLTRVKEGYSDDPLAVKLIDELSANPSVTGAFTLQDGILKHKGRVWLGNNILAQQHVIQAMHSSAVGGSLRCPGFILQNQAVICLAGSESYHC